MDPKSRTWGCKGKQANNRQQQHVQHQHWARANTGMHMSISRSRTATAQHRSWATTSPQEPAAGTVMLLSCWHRCAPSQLKALGPNCLTKQLGQSMRNSSRADNHQQEGQTEPTQVKRFVFLFPNRKCFLCPDIGKVGVSIGPDFHLTQSCTPMT